MEYLQDPSNARTLYVPAGKLLRAKLKEFTGPTVNAIGGLRVPVENIEKEFWPGGEPGAGVMLRAMLPFEIPMHAYVELVRLR